MSVDKDRGCGQEHNALTSEIRSGATFQTTAWTDVLAATVDDSATAADALARLCRLYWSPLYSYVLRNGHSPDAACDLTQQFFFKFLQRESIKKAKQARGRFRTFLLTSLQHFLIDEWKTSRALKRGGDQIIFSLDSLNEAERIALGPAESDTPARAFERRWAVSFWKRLRAGTARNMDVPASSDCMND